MMRLICICLPLVLGPALLAAQQAHPSQKPAGSSAANTPSGQTSHPVATGSHKRHHGARARLAKTSRKGAKRPEYRPRYKENSVEVINGDATRKITFHDEEPATASKKDARSGFRSGPTPMKVDIVNGTSTDTRYFYTEDQQNETARNQPVVIGVQSSDTRTAGGNRHPVVTGITSSSNNDAKTANGGGQPVTKSVAPRPKRPVYEPDSH